MTAYHAYCPSCGTPFAAPGQRFCGSCGTTLAVSAQGAGAAAARPTYSSLPGAAPVERSSRLLLELGVAGAAAVALILPLMAVSASSSYSYLYSSGGTASVSGLDVVQRTNWTAYGELDLIIIGTVASLAIALARAINPLRWSPKATMWGFVALAAGYSWLLLEWDQQIAKVASSYSFLGVSVGVTQGFGLWLGLIAGVVGAIVCLTDSDERVPSPMAAALPAAGERRPTRAAGGSVWRDPQQEAVSGAPGPGGSPIGAAAAAPSRMVTCRSCRNVVPAAEFCSACHEPLEDADRGK